MSQRRNPKSDNQVVALTLNCAGCGASLGSAYQHRGQHPRAGKSIVDPQVGTLVDRPQGGQKLVGECSKCGARPQVLWERVTEHLDRLDRSSRRPGSMSI